jgi:serine/threonine protein kinase
VDLKSKELLGHGRWGFVLRCHMQEEPSKQVAVKLVGIRGAAGAQREWQHGAAIGKHKNIVACEQALLHMDERLELKNFLEQACTVPGKASRDFWPTRYICLVQEFANKGSLGGLLQSSDLEIAGIGSVVRQVASALAYIHSRKRVHNDVKPDNILLHDVGSSGVVVKLGDFGLADLTRDFSRDYELFGLAVFCSATKEPFRKADPSAAQDYAVRISKALNRLEVMGQSSPFNKLEQVQKKLPMTVAQIFRSEIDMKEVEQLEWLQGMDLVVQ